MPSALPMEIVPQKVDIPNWKALQGTFRLLFVGRDYRRKGLDIAIDVTHRLDQDGILAEMTVCGAPGKSDRLIKYVGSFMKNDPKELEQYADLYRQAHLLIHPAYFEPAGIVPGEAAAFGTPTITNDTGGLATTVQDGISGIVLPRGSPAEAYVARIKELIAHPESYYQLCRTARQRYELELNWQVRGKWLAELLREVVAENRQEESHA
jgi:glycosyltransferase involved in cell wall biosynthesis